MLPIGNGWGADGLGGAPWVPERGALGARAGRPGCPSGAPWVPERGACGLEQGALVRGVAGPGLGTEGRGQGRAH
jgi:hypothetical protein